MVDIFVGVMLYEYRPPSFTLKMKEADDTPGNYDYNPLVAIDKCGHSLAVYAEEYRRKLVIYDNNGRRVIAQEFQISLPSVTALQVFGRRLCFYADRPAHLSGVYCGMYMVLNTNE